MWLSSLLSCLTVSCIRVPLPFTLVALLLRCGPELLDTPRLWLPLIPIMRLHDGSIGCRLLLVFDAEIRFQKCSNRFESGHPRGTQ